VRRLAVVVLLSLAATSAAQNRDDWQSLSQLKTGDKVRISLKSEKSFTAPFQNWTPEQVTAGTVSAKKEEVRKVERYRQGAWSRGRTAGVGALVGFGGGFAIGAAAGGCHQGDIFCLPRGLTGAVLGVLWAAVGAGVGALLPHHNKDVIYIAK
jgi:hypothetical protein